jgi:hypothetical protein
VGVLLFDILTIIIQPGAVFNGLLHELVDIVAGLHGGFGELRIPVKEHQGPDSGTEG